MPVYTIQPKPDEELGFAVRPLDGDFRQVFPAGFEFDPVSSDPAAAGNMIRQPDRTYVQRRSGYQGLAVVPDHLPKTVLLEGPKRAVGDLRQSNSVLLASRRFQAVVEGLEPGRHQFVPVRLVWQDGSDAGSFFWVYPCARIDAMDRDRTTHELHRDRYWKHKPGGAYVVSLERVGAHHIWIDPKLLAFDHPFVSARFREVVMDADLNGIGFHELPAV